MYTGCIFLFERILYKHSPNIKIAIMCVKLEFSSKRLKFYGHMHSELALRGIYKGAPSIGACHLDFKIIGPCSTIRCPLIILTNNKCHQFLIPWINITTKLWAPPRKIEPHASKSAWRQFCTSSSTRFCTNCKSGKSNIIWMQLANAFSANLFQLFIINRLI